MIDEKRIKKILLDMREHCTKANLCENCPYKRICCKTVAFLWEDEEIENMAAVLYELLNEVIHAHWVNGICTNCGVEKPVVIAYRGVSDIVYQYQGELNYCPNCGAKMDEKEEEK